jgi:hypothetical protein
LVYTEHVPAKSRNVSRAVSDAAASFHQRLNKTALPKAPAGEKMDEFGKIALLADVYETLVHPPAGQKAFLPGDVIREMLNNKELFALPILKTFLDRITVYPLGSWVRLSSGEIGKVMDINRRAPLRPKVTVIFNPEGERLDYSKHLDLEITTSVYIKSILTEDEIVKLSKVAYG